MANALGEFDKDTPTWQCQTTLATIRRRLDHLMYSPALHCFSARVINARGSDHKPVIAVFGVGCRQLN